MDAPKRTTEAKNPKKCFRGGKLKTRKTQKRKKVYVPVEIRQKHPDTFRKNFLRAIFFIIGVFSVEQTCEKLLGPEVGIRPNLANLKSESNETYFFLLFEAAKLQKSKLQG